MPIASIEWSGIIGTAIGVFLGFGLTVGYSNFTKYIRENNLNKQLREELRANLYSISQKRSLIEKILEDLKEGKILSGKCVPFQRTIYDKHFHELAPKLSIKERSCLHVIFHYLETVDTTLEDFEPRIFSKDTGHSRQAVRDLFEVKLGKNMLPLLDDAQDLLERYLRKDVVDVFATDLPYKKVKEAIIVNKQ